MKKRTTEEMREYQRKRRARQRGVSREEQGEVDKTRLVDTVDMSTPKEPTGFDELEPF
jgi:hypothetical protein